MGLEAATYTGQLTETNPATTDQASQGDDHIRLIKQTLKNTFPGLTFAIAFNSTTKVVLEATSLALMRTALGAIGAADNNILTGTLRLEHDDNGAGASSRLDLVRLSDDPETDDLLHLVRLIGVNASVAETVYAALGAQIKNKTAAAEAGELYWQTAFAGALATRLRLGQGLYTPNAAGTDKGADSINAKQVFREGTELLVPATNLGTASPGMVAKTTSVAAISVIDPLMLMSDGTGNVITVRNFSKTATLASSGAGGLDTGAEGSSRWYYAWAFAKLDGTSTLVLSESASAPTQPDADYDFKCLCAAFYNNSSSNLVGAMMVGRECWTENAANPVSGVAGPATYTSLSLAAYVPPLAQLAGGVMGSSASNSQNEGAIAVAGNANGLGASLHAGWTGTVSLDSGYDWDQWQVPMPTAQTIYWKAGTTTANKFIVPNYWRW